MAAANGSLLAEAAWRVQTARATALLGSSRRVGSQRGSDSIYNYGKVNEARCRVSDGWFEQTRLDGSGRRVRDDQRRRDTKCSSFVWFPRRSAPDEGIAFFDRARRGTSVTPPTRAEPRKDPIS